MHWIRLISILAMLGIAVLGCGQQNDPVSTSYSETLGAFESLPGENPSFGTSVVLGGYLVQFDGRVFSGGQTTFSYTVSGVSAIHALSNFFLEIPGCAPEAIAFSPGGPAVNVSPLNNMFGATWSISVAIDGSLSYSMTFLGEVPLGIIWSHVKAGQDIDLGIIRGPCSGFKISGRVYVDADSNGVRTPEELGITNVTVELDDGNGNVESATTDANGDYLFLRFDGTYTVSIDATTPEIDFNDNLTASFSPTGPTSASVTVGPDSPGHDFGYNPEQEKIILELETGVLPTDGESARFWKKEVRGKGKVEFSPTEVAQFIADIENLFLPDPFQFTAGNESDEAVAILSIKSKDPLEELTRELLVAEFNYVSGKGIDPALQGVLLIWAEAVIVEAWAATSAASVKGGLQAAGGGGDSDVTDALKMLRLMNGATGGGSGGGG